MQEMAVVDGAVCMDHNGDVLDIPYDNELLGSIEWRRSRLALGLVWFVCLFTFEQKLSLITFTLTRSLRKCQSRAGVTCHGARQVPQMRNNSIGRHLRCLPSWHSLAFWYGKENYPASSVNRHERHVNMETTKEWVIRTERDETKLASRERL
jgi:hypothetical protein